jgi:HPt (histidine-containing phosphotransfer) domain-containing protein
MADSTDSVHARLAELCEQYRQGLVARLIQVETTWQRYVEDPPQSETIAEFRGEVHRIAGSAGIFGLPRIGETALALDRFLDSLAEANNKETSISLEQRQQIDALLCALRQAVVGASKSNI